MNRKFPKFTVFVAFSLLLATIITACNNEAEKKTEEPAKTESVPATPVPEDTTKRDTQQTRPIVKPN